jgi:hypothetical protein
MTKLLNGKNNPMLPSDVPLCSARCRTRGGEPCRNAAMPNGRCRMHGGKSPAGIASPAWKSGRFSRYMPKRLLAKYEEYLADDNLIEMRDYLALLDARNAELLQTVDRGGSADKDTWLAVQRLVVRLNAALARGDTADAVSIAQQLSDLAADGVAVASAWAELRQNMRIGRQVRETELKRLVNGQHMISAKDFMFLVAALGASVREHVKDATTLRAIQRDIRLLVGEPNRDESERMPR